ncbi:MAG: hypothetical protein KAY37_06850 [Phycisphaerae bacterium]|nr:hypothetical protein [Phycisphaerae bacterium]
MPQSELERCPVCSGDLGQRPPPNHCPECGFAYDEQTRVWRSGETWARLAVIYALVGLVIGVVVATLYRVSLDRVPNPTLTLLCAVIAPAVGLVFRRGLGGRITGRFVALTPSGIMVGTRSRPLLIPWSDFNRLVERRGITRIQRHGTSILVALDDIFANEEEKVSFRNELTRASKRYRQAQQGYNLSADVL